MSQTALGPIEFAEIGEGPAVVVLHGSMGGWQQAELMMRTLCEPGYRYLLVSRPGYLGTPLRSGESSAAQADLYGALLDSLGIESAAIVGVSAGSPSAIDFALRHPARTWGLALVSACAGSSDSPKPPAVFKIAAQFLRLAPLRNWMRRSWLKNLDKPATMFVADAELRAQTIADPETGPLFAEFLTGTLEQMHLRIEGTLNDVRIIGSAEHALENIAVHTLVVHGTADDWLSYDQHAKAFAARIRDVEVVNLEGAGHAGLFTHRDRARAAVVAYLRRAAALHAGSDSKRAHAR